MENVSATKNDSFDPGWNDPPNLSYNAHTATPNRPRLNKRVAFPLSGSNSSAALPPANVPPLPVLSGHTPLPPLHSNPKVITQEDKIIIDSESTLNEVKEILLKVLEESTELGPKSNDIKRRITTMEEMWISGKLNTKIQAQMKELAYALRDNLPKEADNVHRALMVDHVSAVGTWMTGIKQLIHHCIARAELLAIDDE